MDQENFSSDEHEFEEAESGTQQVKTAESNDEDDVQKHNSVLDDNIEEEFACSVCLRLAVEPTTLTCGHTSCRACLAKWYFSSRKKECPMCRQRYEGHPKVNTQTRNMLLKLCPKRIAEREREYDEDEASKRTVRNYDNALAKEAEGSGKTTEMSSFCSGLMVACCAFVIAYLAWYWQTSDSNLLVRKPVETWKNKDVIQWLEEMSWTADYISVVKEYSIDGHTLLSMKEETIKDVFNISNPVHERALMFAIDTLRSQGIKLPANLWEYKALYPGRSLFLVYGLKDFPRTTLLYLWVYYYEEMFLPFVHSTTLTEEERLNLSSTYTDDPSRSQWINFLLRAALMPEWLVAVFTYQMFSEHLISLCFVLATAFVFTVLELINWYFVLANKDWRSVAPMIKTYGKQLTSAFMFMVFWPITPNLVCDVFFYGALYISPVHGTLEIFKKIKVLNDEHED